MIKRPNRSIVIKGKNNPNYKHGKYCKIYYCIDCGREISVTGVLYGSGKCRSCASKYQLKNNNHLLKYTLNQKGETHPMFGKRHKIKSKKLMSLSHKDKKLSINHKRNISKSLKGTRIGKSNPMFGKVTTAIGGKYKGIYMRSSYEIKFAQFLDLSSIKYLYEPKFFDLGNTTYTPDFYIPDWNLYIEIKGWWREDAKKKFDLFKKLYHKVRIKLLMGKELNKLGVI